MESGFLDPAHVEDVRSKIGDEKLLTHFLDQGEVTESAIAQVSAENAGTQALDLANAFIDPIFSSSMNLADCRRFNAVPVADDGSYLSIALADILDFEIQDAIPHVVNREVQFFAATPTSIKNAWQQICGDEVGLADASELTVVGDASSDDMSERRRP